MIRVMNYVVRGPQSKQLVAPRGRLESQLLLCANCFWKPSSRLSKVVIGGLRVLSPVGAGRVLHIGRKWPNQRPGTREVRLDGRLTAGLRAPLPISGR
jgi:hypothetical protein